MTIITQTQLQLVQAEAEKNEKLHEQEKEKNMEESDKELDKTEQGSIGLEKNWDEMMMGLQKQPDKPCSKILLTPFQTKMLDTANTVKQQVLQTCDLENASYHRHWLTSMALFPLCSTKAWSTHTNWCSSSTNS